MSLHEFRFRVDAPSLPLSVEFREREGRLRILKRKFCSDESNHEKVSFQYQPADGCYYVYDHLGHHHPWQIKTDDRILFLHDMNAMCENVSNQNIDFQLGLLYFAHVLAMVDGELDHSEKMAIHKIKVAEKIPDWVFDDFRESVRGKSERKIYEEGVAMLNRCREDEKLKVFVHLYRLSKADDKVHVREV